jgi:hypothetical protein
MRDAQPGETPAVDTFEGPVVWRVVKVRVRDVRPVREGWAQLLESGTVTEFVSRDVTGVSVGGAVKFSAALTGFERRAVWYASDWRPITPATAER